MADDSGDDLIRVFNGLDTIRARPGMYIGDVGRLGAARLVGCGAEVLAALTVNRDGDPVFTHHAYLHATLRGRDATLIIDHHPDEAPDIADRAADLLAHRDTMRPDNWTLNVQSPNDVAPLPVLRALSDGVHLYRRTGGWTLTILAETDAPPPALPHPEKGALVALNWRIADAVDPSGMTADFLEGFLRGHHIAPGLILRDCRVS